MVRGAAALCTAAHGARETAPIGSAFCLPGVQVHRYHVVELEAEKGMCELQSSTGGYHLARTLGQMPALNAVVHGDRPHLGFGILVCASSGAVFRVIFESINDARLAPRHSKTPSAPPTPTRPGPDTDGSNA